MTVVGKTEMVYVFLFCFFGLFFEIFNFNVNLYVVKHKNREKNSIHAKDLVSI